MGDVSGGQEVTTYEIVDLILTIAILGMLLADRSDYDD